MTREEFIEVLEEKGYFYKIEGDNMIVLQGSVYLGSLKTLPSNIVFKNVGDVYLDSLETLPSGIVFNNGDSVYLNSLTSIHRGVVFNNGWQVRLASLIGIDTIWKGNIDGVKSKRLLNLMIKRAMFI